MIRIAFWFDCPVEYTGGLNYIWNLLYAISLIKGEKIEPYIFFGNKVEESVVSRFRPYAKVVRTSVLDRKSPLWFIHKILVKFSDSLLIVNAIMRKYRISVVSHAQYFYGKHPSYRVIGWIPDFQYLHLPEFFPGLDCAAETARILKLIKHSDTVVMSSYDALNDYNRIAPHEFLPRARVLPFVSQIDNEVHVASSGLVIGEIEKKYGFSGKFFFLPNQFWAHKNHIVVFDAVRLLKEKGRDILIICTGNLYDYRLKNTSYADTLSKFVTANGLQQNIKILGLIDYHEVLFFMRNSVAVLNPSRFEGWSSSVEEAKSIGKPVILSNINVHVEQNPSMGRYFDPNSAVALSSILAEIWDTPPITSNINELEREAADRLHSRTLEYATKYIELVHELANSKGVLC